MSKISAHDLQIIEHKIILSLLHVFFGYICFNYQVILKCEVIKIKVLMHQTVDVDQGRHRSL